VPGGQSLERLHEVIQVEPGSFRVQTPNSFEELCDSLILQRSDLGWVDLALVQLQACFFDKVYRLVIVDKPVLVFIVGHEHLHQFFLQLGAVRLVFEEPPCECLAVRGRHSKIGDRRVGPGSVEFLQLLDRERHQPHLNEQLVDTPLVRLNIFLLMRGPFVYTGLLGCNQHRVDRVSLGHYFGISAGFLGRL